MTQSHYFGVLPASVRYNRHLCAGAKVLYADIWALTHLNGMCFAGNAYFADLYHVSKTSVSHWIAALIRHGYIQATYTKNKKTRACQRVLKICQDPLQKKCTENNTLTESNTINNPFQIYLRGQKIPFVNEAPEEHVSPDQAIEESSDDASGMEDAYHSFQGFRFDAFQIPASYRPIEP